MSTQVRVDGALYEVALDVPEWNGITAEVHDFATGQSRKFWFERYHMDSCRDSDGTLDVDRFAEEVVGPEAAQFDWDRALEDDTAEGEE